MAKHTIGRPVHVPTAAARRRVSVWASGGAMPAEIALALGIDRATLAALYADALAAGAVRCRLEILECVFRAAKRGHIGACRLFLSMPWTRPDGLKARRDKEAQTAQTDTPWAPLLPPAGVQ